ncbi:MAG: hypothetical protein AMXMBFR78_34120 [Rubrivivax sp.]
MADPQYELQKSLGKAEGHFLTMGASLLFTGESVRRLVASGAKTLATDAVGGDILRVLLVRFAEDVLAAVRGGADVSDALLAVMRSQLGQQTIDAQMQATYGPITDEEA